MDQTFKIGDEVKIRADVAGKYLGVTFIVKKFLVKNVELTPVSGGRGLRCKPHLLIPVNVSEALPGPMMVGVLEPPLVCGTLVRFEGELYVVLAEMRLNYYRIAKLGGDGGRYYTKVARSKLTVVDPSVVTV